MVSQISKEILMLMLERMWRIRHFELKVAEVHELGEIGGAHLYIGEEAVAVGACAAMNDSIASSVTASDAITPIK